VMAIGNLVGIPGLVLLFRRRAEEPRLKSFGRPLQILMHGLPVTGRVAFMLFAGTWTLGVVLGILLSQ
jgi:hypothetical protein